MHTTSKRVATMIVSADPLVTIEGQVPARLIAYPKARQANDN